MNWIRFTPLNNAHESCMINLDHVERVQRIEEAVHIETVGWVYSLYYKDEELARYANTSVYTAICVGNPVTNIDNPEYMLEQPVRGREAP